MPVTLSNNICYILTYKTSEGKFYYCKNRLYCVGFLSVRLSLTDTIRTMLNNRSVNEPTAELENNLIRMGSEYTDTKMGNKNEINCCIPAQTAA